MAVITLSNHAMFFNGVSDSIVCPQGDFTKTGHKRELYGGVARSSAPVLQDGDGHRFANANNQTLDKFTVEAWVSPDCGGVIASKAGLFELSMGTVNAPGVASFKVEFTNGVTAIASSANNYPTAAASFISNNVGYNVGQRELYHISGEFNGEQVKLYVNGELMASHKMNKKYKCSLNDQDLFIGGKGGEYRGYIESLHWKSDVSTMESRAKPLMKVNSTIGLWRFEEPVEVDDDEFYITSNVNAGDTTITIGATACQKMYELVSGKSDPLLTTYTLESLGNYQVANPTHSLGARVISVAHTPFNLIINPTATDTLTGLPNNSAPERVRLKQISPLGAITVESIHLDFSVSTDTGARGVLHSRTAFDTSNNFANDSMMVLVRSDLLIDSETGKPYQRLGTSSQAIDRTGAMVIDESPNEFHGFIYSRSLAVGNTFSPASWSIAERFKTGHTGRHKHTQKEGHSFLRLLPPIHEQELTRTIDGISDDALITFAGSYVGLKDAIPINSKAAVSHTATNARIMELRTSATTNGVVRNGLYGIDNNRDGVIAISVDDIEPFLLKGGGIGVDSQSDSQYKKHLTPEKDSRIAILEVSGLTAGYVEVHYNAVDLTGEKMGLSNPALLVTKTVPDGGCFLNTKRVAEHIADAVAAGATIHSPGGVITASSNDIGTAQVALKPHHLVGDNAGGFDYEKDLNESLLPANYTPRFTGEEGNAPPQGVATTTHPSAYHKIHIQPMQRSASDPPVNEAPTHYQESVQFASQKGGAFEMFDIIDNDKVGDSYIFIVQPSKRERTMQLSRATPATVDFNDCTYFTIEYVQSTVRISSMEVNDSGMGRYLIMEGQGIMTDVSDQTVSYAGDGSRDSHIVKEIQPGAPVVSVTLGGPGQGAVNTKPSWDPATLSRVGWNTRHACAVAVNDFDGAAGTITVQPLNNKGRLANWGTYCFPATGRIYLSNGANAEYDSKTSTTFTFTGGADKYILANGRRATDFADWVTSTGFSVESLILLDPQFDTSSVCSDGTTVNDRLFQSISSVQHDYQLGSQYASTRALVEIPLFPNQFFEDRDAGVFPGPDNSMKLHLDATMTAQAWNPSPVGRRAPNYPATDYEAFGHYQYASANNLPIRSQIIDINRFAANTIVLDTNHIADSKFDDFATVKGVSTRMTRKIILGNGEWAYYEKSGVGVCTVTLSDLESHSSKDFFSSLSIGAQVLVGVLPNQVNFPLTGDINYQTTGQEYRRPFYYDRGSVMTQGGNLDYGLRQYVSAVEFKAGPTANPHLARIQSKNAVIELVLPLIPPLYTGPGVKFGIKGNLPKGKLPTSYEFAAINEATGRKYRITYNSTTEPNFIAIQAHPILDPTAPTGLLATGDELVLLGVYSIDPNTAPLMLPDSIANSTWNNPYCPGGLRYGDTIWANMHYTNPHAIEGLFAKSRGVYNEYEVWRGFNGGKGELGIESRDTLPLENFLIGDTCIETARNYVQHVNKTIELNWIELGHDVSTHKPPIVAYLDPYLSTETHARVLLYDVAHDREFIAFHDLHMQVQTNATTPTINELDVAAGFRTQRKDKHLATKPYNEVIDGVTYEYEDGTGKSHFIEGAYAHRSWYLMDNSFMTPNPAGVVNLAHNRKARNTPHYIKFGDETTQFGQGRTAQSTVDIDKASLRHAETIPYQQSEDVQSGNTFAPVFTSTFFDTPEGTRVISAFLCLKGKRASVNDTRNHYEDRLQHLPHWTDMDFVRRLTIDMGEVGLREGVTDIEAAAREVVRLINQAGALNGRSSQRRPSDQYPGEGERFDINRRAVSVGGTDTDRPTDATAAHHHADFSVTGSTHDPAPFWADNAFTSFNRGSHMGYLRAHLGRVVEDANGNEGFSVVIHSTVPGATSRNFCVWLDNSKGQAEYKPQYLIGHGGRFRNFYCAPPEVAGENMHPAPMPIDKNGKPFAPITTLREYVALDEASDEFFTNLHLGFAANFNTTIEGEETPNTGATTGRSSNTGSMESFENGGQKYSIREGLQTGSRAYGRVNFGGIVAAGIPGFAPDAGLWGFGEDNKPSGRFQSIYGQNVQTTDDNYAVYSSYAPPNETADTFVGNQPLYGMKLVDHRGKSHFIRYIYRRGGESFSHKNSVMPNTIDEETLIYFDDRDIGQGGFTIGANMWGHGSFGTPFFYSAGLTHTWRGNKWRGVYTPNAGYAVTVKLATPNNTLTLKSDSASCGLYGKGIWHQLPDVDDVLGHMGFPDSGLIWVAKPQSNTTYERKGLVFSYTHRTHSGRGGPHAFFGLQGFEADAISTYHFNTQDRCGPTTISDDRAPTIISPHLNQTTIVTDELIAAATNYAFTVDPNEGDQYFDCSHLRAPDGRTYGEILGDNAQTAIKIGKFNQDKEILPIGKLFSSSLSRDWGLQASNTDADINTGSAGGQFGGATVVQDKKTHMAECGYIPYTLLQISTRFKGSNANTATPIFVDQSNNAISTDEWQKHLRGEKFTRYEGDHITPSLEAATYTIDTQVGTSLPGGTEYTTYQLQLRDPANFAVLGRQYAWQLQHISGGTNLNYDATTEFGGAIDGSWSPFKRLELDSETYLHCAALSSIAAPTDVTHDLIAWHHGESKGEFKDKLVVDIILQRFKFVNDIHGLRLRGNRRGNPLLYFRGGQDSIDNHVPLYFGGGFSGVVMDINDGSRVDYSTHNKHPYANGPTGSTGMQDIGEKMGAYALLDTTALFAMFPATVALDQHRGEATPPFANQNAILNTDIDGNTNTHTIPGTTYTNVNIAKPTPVVLRFAHPYARYDDSVNSVAYMIFGPGQAVPKHWYGEGAGIGFDASVEPSAKWTVANKLYTAIDGSVATAFEMGVESGFFLPNELSNTVLRGGANQFLPMTDVYGAENVFPYSPFRHWEPSYGSPNINFNQQYATEARYVTHHFANFTQGVVYNAGNEYSHPFSHYRATSRFTNTSWHLSGAIYHLDGGYTAGGSWFDNSVRKNPPHPVEATLVNSANAAVQHIGTIGLNATMFRVGSQVLTDYDDNLDAAVPDDVFLIDATRCQNSEELGAVVASAINTWPGRANLKALGGTFLPSFQDAQRQDRYGWIDVGLMGIYTPNPHGLVVMSSGPLPKNLPEFGWIRLSNGTRSYYGYYSHYDKTSGTFILGNNQRSMQPSLEECIGSGTGAVPGVDESSGQYKVFVWSKTGNLRWDNGFQNATDGLRSVGASGVTDASNSPFDHYATTQVHFSGVVDAIDRTRAVGAVGWHGERYSMLNSLTITDDGPKVASGLGAWHPITGFSPYGAATACHQQASIEWVLRAGSGFGEEENIEAVWVPNVSSHDAVGLHQRHFVVISYEGDLPIIAKASRNGQQTCGDMLQLKWSSSTQGGTVTAYHNERFNNDRYNAESNAGPHVEAIHDTTMTFPRDDDANSRLWSHAKSGTNDMAQMETCLYPTGDLFYDKNENKNKELYPTDPIFDDEPHTTENVGYNGYNDHRAQIYTYFRERNAARNFFTEHVVWKRMGGGNLTLPAQNARGLGSIPWQIHKVGSEYVKFGETIYGNVRFSFETTNAAMYPIIQAQELASPALAEQYPYEVRNALTIPNEEKQFEEISVVDDTGQEHKIAGGSPLGVVIRDYELIQDRETQGLAPAIAGSGDTPNMEIQLPDHDNIPGNILVRAGYDRLQAYQHETLGSGGLQHPQQPSSVVRESFESLGLQPRTEPFWEQDGYEHINQNPNNFPDSNNTLQSDNILQTAYEPHDRALYFHITKMGYTYTEREPMAIVSNVMTINRLTVASVGTNTITTIEFINANIWKQDPTPDGRYFIAINGTIASFTDPDGNLDGTTNVFENVVFAPDFTASAGDSIKPSFYIPAGSTRQFAARRLRDHAEVSGNSPDKPHTDWHGVTAGTSPATAVRAANKLTPMPLPRMGHHYVMPTMAMMPGHLAHPLYQQIYSVNRACQGSTDYDTTKIIQNPLFWFSSPTAPNPPSDIHGDGFTLLTETKIRFDGYGIADDSASCNKAGGHRIQLEAGTNYNTAFNFPDPAEVGAYQIVIQPNLFSKQFMGNNENTTFASTEAPEDPGGTNATVTVLTDQLVATVVAMQGRDLILSEATMADVRGCEIYLNEIMLDIDPSTREQFTNIPMLGLNNPFGVNATSSGAFTRRSMPYHPNMFHRSTPGHTISVPWWSVAFASSTIFNAGASWKGTEQYHPDDYYHFCRSTLGGIGCQTTMLGYPSHYLDVYTDYLTALTPVATIEHAHSITNKLFVRNNILFPVAGDDYFKNHLIVVGDDGKEFRASYTNRGYVSGVGSTDGTVVFHGVTEITTGFFAAATQGKQLRMTRKYGFQNSNKIYTSSEESVATRNLPQLLSGTRDTNSLHLPDAYLCMWHYNLGRPMTWFSDSRTNKGDAAVDKKAYNHAPEHFEMVHYHEFAYAMSDGPFKFRAKSYADPSGAMTDTYPDSTLAHQAGEDGLSRRYNFGAFWPGGHRFGAQMSSLSIYGTCAPGWRNKWDDPNIKQVSDAKGLIVSNADVEALTETVNGVANTMKQAGWGYRISVRQPYNRPRWAIKSNQGLRDPHTYYHFDAEGPFVGNQEVTTTTNVQSGSGNTTPTDTTSASYAGIIERQTNASALIGSDLKGQQVRYSDGRRMTKGFGCAVRNIRNPTTALRKFHADLPAGLKANTNVVSQRVNLALAQAHYMVDWWGNTTGEDVRRFPVRGFGIRPSWDPEDAYRATDRTKTPETMYSTTGVKSAEAAISFFDPATAKRVGDRGDGRGVRYPTYFNEDILQDVSEDMRPFGLVLSHHTSEPPFTSGFLRASNIDLQPHELPRGMSSLMEIAGDDGLLKREANVGSNIEKTNFEFMREPIAKSKPRIGIDGMTVVENDGEIAPRYIITSTEATSLHTDRQAGQRYIFSGGVSTANRAIDNLNLNALNLSTAKQVLKFGTTHGIPPIGGTYIMEVSSDGAPISDFGWGASSGVTTNPYQTDNHDSLSYRTNTQDQTIKFLVRPVRVLDNKHIELFRDDTSHVLSATAAGRYGVFMYDAPNARATQVLSNYMRNSNPTPNKPPYAPVYLFDLSTSTSAPSSVGPKIPGSEASDFTTQSTQPVARMIVTNNTLQHLRADASRQQSVVDGRDTFLRKNFTVQPRYTQSLYAGDKLNTSDHASEGDRTDNGVGA
tara:strand:+ start:968 stop:16339 length:15372 start_codon:yes stop_codon:yes gene_type:complete